MKVTILKNILKDGLLVVEKATAKSSSLPILSNIRVVVEKNTLELSATDLEIGVRYRVLAQSDQIGGIVFQGRLLSQFLDLLSEAQVTLCTTQRGLQIKSKQGDNYLKTLSSEDFPIIPSLQGDESSIEVETKALCLAVEQVVGMTSQAQTRPTISGVYFSFEKEILKIVATDSFRLAEKTLSVSPQQSLITSFILPSKAAKELVSIFGGRQGKTKVFISKSQVMFSHEGKGQPDQPKLELVSRLIEGDYPQYQEIIPKESRTKIIVGKADFLNHLKRAALFSGKMNDVNLIFNPIKKNIELAAKSSDAGEHTSFVAAGVEGEAVEIAFNWRFLAEGIAHFKGEDLEFSLNGEEAPAVLRSLGEKEYLYVLMPIKA